MDGSIGTLPTLSRNLGKSPAEVSPMIRALRPTDVLAYLAFSRSLGSLGVDGSERSGADLHVLILVTQFLGRSLGVELGRETWVQIDRGRIYGLVAAKRREGADIWDIDELLFLQLPDADRT